MTATAQEDVWKWTSSPQSGHCWMGIGHAGRKFSLHATSGLGNFIGLDAPGLSGEQEGRITFASDTPQGQRYSLHWNTGDTPSLWMANGIGEDGVIAILQGFIMADSFESGMSVSLGDIAVVLAFPASGSTVAAAGFAGCWDQL
jgi:hypothetical protein